MVRHIICFKLKEATGESIEKAKEILLRMKENVPTIKNIDVKIDELRSQRSYDIILFVDVENWEALDEYQKDDYHCNVVKKYMHAHAENSIAIDYKL